MSYPRHCEAQLLRRLAHRPAVFLMGARQVGKSTLATEAASGLGFRTQVTLDDTALRDLAQRDPTGFMAQFDGPVLIDEVQRAPDLLLEIKRLIDLDRRPGRFLLTGSANVYTAPRVQDALTGRLASVELWPLSQAELAGVERPNFVDHLLEGLVPDLQNQAVGRGVFAERVAVGGYPEVISMDALSRREYFEDYLAGTLLGDLATLADLRRLDVAPLLLRKLAGQVGGLLSIDRLAGELGLAAGTAKTYVALLETLFLVRLLPAWRAGLQARTVRAPKVTFTDSGLLAAVLGANAELIASDDRFTGPLLESFVAAEVDRLIAYGSSGAHLFHYRAGRDEVDLVLESPTGDIATIEVKASATADPRDLRVASKLRDTLGARFRAGIVLHPGARTLQLGDRLWAVPLAALWSPQASG